MAIIKCPECGHQISDKAPVCPACGVEIAGKTVKCPYCGEVYFKSETACPHCHKTTPISTTEIEQTTGNNVHHSITNAPTTTPVTEEGHEIQNNSIDKNHVPENNPNRKNNKTIIFVSVAIALLVLGTCLYFYNNAKSDREQEEYIFAMQSDDPTILQAYLNNFKDAPQAHIDSIARHLEELNKIDQDWTDAVVMGSKRALTEYLNTHPDSPHKQEALEKIDSIDWAQCQKLNTADAYQLYIDSHYDGNHYEEAVIALNKIKSSEVTPDDKQFISSIFHNFFICINSRDESNLTANIGDNINFLGKPNATKADIVSFMNKIYKENVESMIWSITSDYEISKKEIGDLQYEYSTTFMVSQDVKKNDGTNTINKFRINAKVDPDGKITEMAMTRIIE